MRILLSKMLKLISFYAFAIFYVCVGIQHTRSAERPDFSENNFKFKIGFEFQNIDNLCDWALHRYPIQKKPIFTIRTNDGKKLWDLVIDTQDIEFVTPPFRSDFQEDGEQLEKSIHTIVIACEVLQALFATKQKLSPQNELINFKHWIDGRPLPDQEEALLPKYLISNVAGLQKTGKELKLTQNGLKKTLEESQCTLELHDLYLKVRYEKFRQNNTIWQAKFMPQVTIQHNLEFSLPLAITLFGSSKSTKKLTEAHSNYLAAIPYYDRLLDKSFNQETYPFTKENGLCFLHAFICANLITEEKSENKLLVNTYEAFQRNREVDAKLSLSILSRRPLSHMRKDIPNKLGGSFKALYEAAMIEGNTIFKTKNVKSAFNHINYAEEYYGTSESRPDYEKLLPLFKKDNSRDRSLHIRHLLGLGIFSTAMIRLLEPSKVKILAEDGGEYQIRIEDIFENYFEHTLNSVDAPDIRYELDTLTENKEQIIIKKVKSDVDSLSPPFFLDSEDSMGHYKDRDQIDLDYGEAIIEFRKINHISRDMLELMMDEHQSTNKVDSEVREQIVDSLFGKFLMCDDDSYFNMEKGLLFQVNILYSCLKRVSVIKLQENFFKNLGLSKI